MAGSWRGGVCIGVVLLASGSVRTVAYAQPSAAETTWESKPLSFGVRAGVDFAWYGGDDVAADTVEAKMGYAVGAVMAYRINRTFAFAPELLYVMKGTESSTDLKVTIWLNYLAVPLLARASFLTEGQIHPFVYAGPELAFLLTAKGRLADQPTQDIKDSSKTIELSLDVGAGVEIAKPNGQAICFDVRYTHGFTTVDDGRTPSDVENRVVLLDLAYMF